MAISCVLSLQPHDVAFFVALRRRSRELRGLELSEIRRQPGLPCGFGVLCCSPFDLGFGEDLLLRTTLQQKTSRCDQRTGRSPVTRLLAAQHERRPAIDCLPIHQRELLLM